MTNIIFQKEQLLYDSTPQAVAQMPIFSSKGLHNMVETRKTFHNFI